MDDARIQKLREGGWEVWRTSAREDTAVEEAFESLAHLAVAHARG